MISPSAVSMRCFVHEVFKDSFGKSDFQMLQSSDTSEDLGSRG